MGDTLLLGLDPNQRIDPATGRAFVAQPEQQQPSIDHASLSGPAPSFVHPDERVGLMKTMASSGQPRRPEQVRKLTDEELMQKANELIDNQRVQAQVQMQQGPATGPRDASGGQLPAWLTQYMDQ